ncbi:hypothetical protein B566_EDAN007246 [Ephemera danica]|nr:hypothetical protein B566_EDAN007246 [Ephemera danica]
MYCTVNADLPLAPGERVLINRVLAVAANYKRLKEFIDGVISSLTFLDKPRQAVSCRPEQYLLALCSGLSEVLEAYRKAIDTLEEVILLDPHQPVSFVLTVVDEYACLLRVLNFIINKVESDGDELTGCRILELLHINSLSVDANVQVAVQRVQSRCHEVLFKQLASWLFQGHLSDENEFFIQHASQTSESMTEIEVVEDNRICTAYADFKLNKNLLPSYIPLSLALNILYVGQTVVMIQQTPTKMQEEPVQKSEVDVWGGRDMEFLQELQVMQNASTFQLDRLTWLVDAARLCVTQHLWRMAVCDARLVEEAKLIKDLFLLGRGELFLEFIQLADLPLSQPPTQLTLKEANQSLRTAARNIHWEDEGLFDKFHLSLASDSKKGWDGLNLQFNVQWPLHLLFDDLAFSNYNLLFRFLLRTRRAQRDLHALWKKQMQEKILVSCEENPDLWQLRRNFTFLVDNLQYYLQVDVLESQYSTFINAISATDKFEDVQQAHSRALASIMSQTFLLGVSVSKN